MDDEDTEPLETICRDSTARRMFLRLAALSQSGRTPKLLEAIAADEELDDATKRQVAELAQDRPFLLALEDYLVRTGGAQ